MANNKQMQFLSDFLGKCQDSEDHPEGSLNQILEVHRDNFILIAGLTIIQGCTCLSLIKTNIDTGKRELDIETTNRAEIIDILTTHNLNG
jgi:hypothetical protein